MAQHAWSRNTCYFIKKKTHKSSLFIRILWSNIYLISFLYLSPNMKKGVLILGIRGWNFRNNRNRYRHVYTYSWSGRKKKTFLKNARLSVRISVRPSVRSLHYNSGKGKDNWIRFPLFERCIHGIDTANNDPNARRLTKIKPNEIFNDFAISRESIDEIWNRSHEDGAEWKFF